MSAATGDSRRPNAGRRRVSVTGVIGEILLTSGVLILMYLGWELWLNDLIFGASQGQTASALSQQWANDGATSSPTATPTPGPSPTAVDPVVMTAPAANTAFATLIVPRFGPDFHRPIAQGVGKSVLNNAKLGLGHYPTTQMPGQIGNFALASHRSAYGGAFHITNQLVVGDPIFVETQDGWYEYLYRDTEYVKPSGVSVILPVPQQSGLEASQRFITLTTCNPLYSSAERMISYGVFYRWYPRADGPPPEIAATVGSASG